MPFNQKMQSLLEEVLQPRDDYFAIEKIQPLLIKVIEILIDIGDGCWEKADLVELVLSLQSGSLMLASTPGQGVKGIQGKHPIHGALLKIVEFSEAETDKRLYLLSHIANVAYQWRLEIQHADRDDLELPGNKKRLNHSTYISNLETACKIARRINNAWLTNLTELNGSSAMLQQKLRGFIADEDTLDDKYIQQLERFLAYALNSRRPRRGYKPVLLTALRERPAVGRVHGIDDDLDTIKGRITSSKVIFRAETVNDDQTRQSGLSLTEENAPIELLQSDQPIATEWGDSSLQAVFRARSQQRHLDKNAQLLPGRWEQLSYFDVFQLQRQLKLISPSSQKKLGCIIGLLFITGRSLDCVLNAHVVNSHSQVPQKLGDQAIYLLSNATEWVSGVYRPEHSRRINNRWRAAMRTSLDQISMPIPEFCQQLTLSHTQRIGFRVNKRSAPLFPELGQIRLKQNFKQLLSDTNRKTGARLTAHRLSLHLFNRLNDGDADLTSACLLTARAPSAGQQASLYYYAPELEHLKQQYTSAQREVEQQWLGQAELSTPSPDMLAQCSTNIYPTISQAAVSRNGHVGSQLVPTKNYVTQLVAHMQQQLRSVDHTPSLFQGIVAFHNAYTAYTIAMLMFCTGYRSIRDPLPKIEHICLARAMIVIADKTDDQQSHTRFLPLSKLMVTQFKDYFSHREAIISRLRIFLQYDWETPFMFLDEHGHPRQVTPKRLENNLQWPLSPPLNINRHYLHTQLKEFGCSSEIVDAFMGHWDAGQEPWAKYSTFCPRRYRDHIVPLVEDLMHQQGWKAMKGIAI